MEFMDIFNDDAFTLTSLTATMNNIDHVPGRAGELAFVGAAEGVSTLTVAIEAKGETLSLIPTSARGGPAPKEVRDRGTLRNVSVPQIKLEETIGVHSIMGVRQFGSINQLLGVQTVVNQQMLKMNRRHDLTLEHHRLGALKGLIKDADGSTLANLFTLFGISAPADINFQLTTATTDVRGKCAEVIRAMKRGVKLAWPSTAKIYGFAGDAFFDALINHANVKAAYANWNAAAAAFGDSFVFGQFPFGGIIFENYQGTDDTSTVAVATDECRFFAVGVPGLYAEYFAPADFMETVGTIGLPRYAKVAPDTRFNQFVELHTQQNPLPLCLRPQTLIKGIRA